MSLDPYRVTVNFPEQLKPEFQERWKQLGYPSISAWITGLAIFDLYCNREHKVTLPLMKEPPYVRDIIIAELKEKIKDPNSERPGGWFDRLITGIIAEEKQKLADAEAAKGTEAPKDAPADPPTDGKPKPRQKKPK